MSSMVSWQKSYKSLQSAMRIGQASIEKGTAYIYRVGSIYYEAALACFLTQAKGEEWKNPIQEALRLFELSEQTDDCHSRRNYPFNLARMYLEWYLGQWLLGDKLDPILLDRAINLYVEGLWEQEHQPLSSLSVLPMGYLLRQDGEHLAQFWDMLAKRVDPAGLPAELALWFRWSALLKGNTLADSDFWKAYDGFSRQLSDPLTQPAKFYLAAAKISQQLVDPAHTPKALLNRLAIEPWTNRQEAK